MTSSTQETTMRRLFLLCALFGAATANPPAAAADVPARLPVQGFLTDADGVAVSGSVQIELRLYDVASGGTAWFSETQVAQVDAGQLTVQLGAVAPLDLAEFRRGTAFLGVTLMGEAEMSPRLSIGSVPYAAYAQETASVPTGAVMMFDLAACPEGWSELSSARGRALVGLPAGGTLGGTVGAALGDVENRAHAHSFDPDGCMMSAAGGHSHTVSTSVTSDPTDLAHHHSANPGPHRHRWATFAPLTRIWNTWNVSDVILELVDWGDSVGGGIGAEGEGEFPLEHSGATATTSYYTEMTDQAAFLTGGTTNSAGTSISMNHSHQVDISTGTSSVANHTHTCDAPGGASGDATTGDITPYLQLLVCRKD
jgi:hypothetical protein